MRRYRKDRPIRGGRMLATASGMSNVRRAVRSGTLVTTKYTSKEGDRLDNLAAIYLGDSRLWWVLAATSGIGWSLQLPPGTLIRIPDNMAQVQAMF
mgnify:FL=1